MEERFKVCPHEMQPGKMMVEYWRRGKFVAGIYPHQDGIITQMIDLWVREKKLEPPSSK